MLLLALRKQLLINKCKRVLEKCGANQNFYKGCWAFLETKQHLCSNILKLFHWSPVNWEARINLNDSASSSAVYFGLFFK